MDVNQAGGLSAYGTMGQGGNLYEMMESAFVGANDLPAEARTIRGGYWGFPESDLRSSFRNRFLPTTDGNTFTYRIASVPEPTVGLSLILAGGLLLARRRKSTV